MEGSVLCPLMPQAACCALPIAWPTRRPSDRRDSLKCLALFCDKRPCTKRSRRSTHCTALSRAWPGPATGVGG